MKINIFYICLGKYVKFFDKFYETCEKFFLPKLKKNYTVITDSEIKLRDNVNIINQKKLGWPYDTMMRFHFFNRVKNEIYNFDYCFFFNANMVFVNEINEETIPNENHDWLVGVNHPLFYNKNKNMFPYERNINSQFYIPFNEGNNYLQGCYIGGRTKEFFEMSEILENKIDIDLKNHIIPVWHDESAFNHFILDKKCLVLDPGYAYPESIFLPFKKMAIQLDKNNHGGHDYMRS